MTLKVGMRLGPFEVLVPNVVEREHAPINVVVNWRSELESP